jgi:hypothetical protein
MKEYTDENTILVTRIQFLAIEIARNRQGLNDSIYNENSKVSYCDSNEKSADS